MKTTIKFKKAYAILTLPILLGGCQEISNFFADDSVSSGRAPGYNYHRPSYTPENRTSAANQTQSSTGNAQKAVAKSSSYTPSSTSSKAASSASSSATTKAVPVEAPTVAVPSTAPMVGQ